MTSRATRAELRRSEHAGGGRKNRLVDVERTFESGRYLLYYGTDDSHSFDEFNANPPYDPLNWGVAVFPGAEFDAQAFRTFVPGPLPQPPCVWLQKSPGSMGGS